MYCEGHLIWDYERGEVICAQTGEVVDRIYDYGPCKVHQDVTEDHRRRNYDEYLRIRDHERFMRLHRYHLKMYYKAMNMVKNRPWLNINYTKLFAQGKFVRTIESSNTQIAIKNVKEIGLYDILNKIAEALGEIDPMVVSRTERSKLALAYMYYKTVICRERIDLKEVSRIFMISITTCKRLEKLLKRIMNKIPKETIKARIL